MSFIPYVAPAFKLKDSNGKFHSLIDYKGSWLVLYFYPKDDTPGCTVEACGFRDMRDELTDLGAQVVGISKDDISLHEKFKSKYNLNFTLLSDPKGEVIETYGAWGPKMFGRLGIQRKTFLIDPDGMIQKVYARVIPKGHNQQVINDLQRLRAE
jgi:peroxiredoxin Q/BCP